MSFETNASGRRPKWASRRILGSVLGLAVVVGTGATAQASGHGDGFLGPRPAVSAAPTASHAGYNNNKGYNNGYNGYNGGHATRTWWNNQWTWNGWGVNKYAFRTIGDNADPTFNQLLGINEHGTIVGYYGSGADAKHPNKGFWVNSPYGPHNFRNENFPRSAQTQVVAINNDGTTVGFYVDKLGNNHGFIRTHGYFQRVDYPGSKFNQLLGVSANGLVVGFFNDAKDKSHGYLYNLRTRSFTLIVLPIKATSVTATGVNRNGQVVGFATVGKVTVGFIWSKHSFVILKFGDGTNTQALGINDRGAVVGSFVGKDKKTHGFVRENNGRVRTIDAPHSTSTVVNGLNNKGQLVGFYERNKRTLGFLAHS